MSEAAATFVDRRHAGRVLARHLTRYGGRDDVVALALPRGGVPVAFEVARELRAPLDVWLVRKLGVPDHEELAMGAVAWGGFTELNADVVEHLGIGRAVIEAAAWREQEMIARCAGAWGIVGPPDVADRVILLVDDGLATGATMRAALASLRSQRPRRIIVAVPVGSSEACRSLVTVTDEVVCARVPPWFDAVGRWYEDFSETTDADVRALLTKARVELLAGRSRSSQEV